jgi:drug/metabolite transporter (DMT)-like permease
MAAIPFWYFTILLYFVASTTYSILQRRLALRSKVPLSLLPALFFGVVVYPIGVLVAVLTGHFHAAWSLHSIILVVFASLFIGTFNVVPFHINKHIDATQYIIISNIYTPLTVLLGVFVLHEHFVGRQFIGMVLLLFGAILVAIKGIKRSSWRLDRWSLFCAATSLLLGVGLVLERASLNYFSASSYMIVGWGMQTIVTSVLAGKDWLVIKNISHTDWVDILKVGLARTGHVIGFLLSVALSRNIALIATVSSFRIPLVFIASFVLLKERDHLPRRLAGVAIATIGLLLM